MIPANCLYDLKPSLVSDIDLAIARLGAIQRIFEGNQSISNATRDYNAAEFWSAQALCIDMQVRNLRLERRIALGSQA